MNQTSSNASFQTLLQIIVHQTLISISNQIFFSFLPLCGLPPPSTRFSSLVMYKENLAGFVETYDPMLFLIFLHNEDNVQDFSNFDIHKVFFVVFDSFIFK
jgi:hypothetical protein